MQIANERTLARGLRAALVCLAAAGLCAAQEPDPAKGDAAFQKVCGTCHTPQSVLTTRRPRAQWQETIDKMIAFGAKASDEEFAAILNYLSAQYGPDASNPPTSISFQ